MADRDDISSSSENGLEIVIDPPLTYDANDSGSIQGDNAMDFNDNATEPSTIEPWLQVRQEHETLMQMQETQAQMRETQAQMQETQAQMYETQVQIHLSTAQEMQETQVQMQETQAQMQETQAQMYETQVHIHLSTTQTQEMQGPQLQMHETQAQMLETQAQMYETQVQIHMMTAHLQENQVTQAQIQLMTAQVQENQVTQAQMQLPTAYMREMQAHMFGPPPLLYHRPPLHFEPPPLHQPSTSRAYGDFITRAGPSGVEASELDHMMRIRPRAGYDYQHSSRRAPYELYHRDTSSTTTLRRSRFVRQQGIEVESQPPPLAYPALHNIQQYPTSETVQYNAVRRSMNLSITPESSPQTFYPRFASQYSRQSPLMVYIPGGPPKLVPITAARDNTRTSPLHAPLTSLQQTPRNTPLLQNIINIPHCSPLSTPRSSPLQTPRITPRSSPLHTPRSSPLHTSRNSPQYTPHSPDAAPVGSFEAPSTSHPLDLSLLPREAPTLIPILPSSSWRRAEACALVRSTPRTHTVTSTVNTTVYYPYDLLPRLPLVTEKSNQSGSRIEQYTSFSDHLLNRPTNRRARTPVEYFCEYQQYLTWPVDNLDRVDHIEEVETTDPDSLIDSIRSLDTTLASANLPPPRIFIVPLVTSTSSPVATTSASPPRTTSS